MKASIIDLRYNMKAVLKALRRKESVQILYHGKKAGVIHPVKTKNLEKIANHPYFGISKASSSKESVQKKMAELRSLRHRAL